MKINSRNGLYFKYQFPSRSEVVFNLMKWFIRNGHEEDEIYDIFYENNTIIKAPFDVYFQAEYMRAWGNIVEDETYIELETLRKNILTNPFIFSIKELQIILAIISMGLRHNTLNINTTYMNLTRMTGIVHTHTLKHNIEKLVFDDHLQVNHNDHLTDFQEYSFKSSLFKRVSKCVYSHKIGTLNSIELQLHEIQALGWDFLIVELLRDEDMDNKTMGDIMSMNTNGINKKLKRLITQHIVKFYKNGRTRIYQLTDEAEDIIYGMTTSQLINTAQIVKQRMDRKREFDLRKALDIKEVRYTGNNPTHKKVNGKWVKL